jgi:choline dehydrogenase-like flavoprotein
MFDAIVIGSGMSGAIAAKELCERGLKTLVLERGRKLDSSDYTDWMQPWEVPDAGMIPEEELARDYEIQRQCYAVTSATKQYWVKDSEHPYSTPDDKPFNWIRGYHLGGRSLMWGRQGRPRCRLADPLRRSGTLVRSRRKIHRRRRIEGGHCHAARWRIPATVRAERR